MDPSGDVSGDVAPAVPPGAAARARDVARSAFSALVLPAMQRAARDHVGGATLEDAMCVAERLRREGLATTVGVWNAPGARAREVAAEYRRAVARLAHAGLDGYLSLKPPAIRFDRTLAGDLASDAAARGIRLHADSHGLDVADASNAMLEAMLERVSGDRLGTTIPGRWARSPSDAEWAVRRGIGVRVVRGQWPDPSDPTRDARAGLLEVIARLAGCARHVAVATHDVALAAEAIGTLRAASTPCELELLFGLPMARALAWAAEHGVAVRVYVPYGEGYLPHALAQLRRNPRFLWWIARDLVASRARR